MDRQINVRNAREEDAENLLEIYRPYVENTAVSFEYHIPTVVEYSDRIRSVSDKWLWLVAEENEKPIGYAYGSSHRPREAYKYPVETTVYVHESNHRRGIARLLYTELLAGLADRDYRNAYAGVALPNEASIKFHQSMRFEFIGVFPLVGNKFGQWYDVAWLHKSL